MNENKRYQSLKECNTASSQKMCRMIAKYFNPDQSDSRANIPAEILVQVASHHDSHETYLQYVKGVAVRNEHNLLAPCRRFNFPDDLHTPA